MSLLSTCLAAFALFVQAQTSVPSQPVAPPASVRITSDNPPPPTAKDVDHTMANPYFDGAPAHKNDRAGVTRANIKPHLSMTWADTDTKSWLDTVEIQFSIRQRIAISSLYPEGSCPFRATFEHEKGHWTDNQGFLDEELAQLKVDLALLKLPTARNPTTADKRDAVEASIAAAIRERQKSFVERARAAVLARDAPEAYMKNDYSKCVPPKTKTVEWITREP